MSSVTTEWLSAKEAAFVMGIDRWTLYRLMRSKNRPRAYRIAHRFQFRRADLDAWIEEQRV